MENFHNDYNMGYKHGKVEGKKLSIDALDTVIEDMKSKDNTPLSIAINAIFSELYQKVYDKLL